MESLSTAVADFRRARSRAALQEIVARLTGKSTELLSYEEVRQKVRSSGVISRGLKEIPLDTIVGSVGRYNDFSRTFLPLQESDAERWARVKVAVSDQTGLPPVELYQIGETYFVHDGHHRVSVARSVGATHIQAYVTQVRSKVPLTPDIQPEELILVAEYADFLDITRLDEHHPEADLRVTVPGQYQMLLEHIEVHRHYMGLEQEREIPYEEAVTHWYTTVYLPVMEVIHEQGIMHDFPDRTETDLYLWIARHRADLEEHLGWSIPYSDAATDLAEQSGSRLGRVMMRIGRRALDIVIPDELESGPLPGSWRRERVEPRPDDRAFADVLVPLSGTEEESWFALEQAVEIARREGAELHGLFVVADEKALKDETAVHIRDRFDWRLGEVGLVGDFVVDVGSVARTICDRARFVDLIVLRLAHPPGKGPLTRLGSGFRTIVRRCSRPILAVPGANSPLSKALLAYDGSAKSREALFAATYLSGRWEVPLVVATIAEVNEVGNEHQAEARFYLEEHGVSAEYVSANGTEAKALLALAETHGCDWFIMGGYGPNPVVEVVLGSVVDSVLRETDKPVLICR